MYFVRHIPNLAFVELVISRRLREMRRLQAKHDRLVRQNFVLQADQIRRDINHLAELNQRRRGPAEERVL